MLILSKLTLYVAIFFCGSEIVLSRIRKSSAETTQVQQDKNTLHLLWVVIMLAMVIGIKVGFMFPRTEPCTALRWSGLAVFVIGFALRWSAILQLGKGFTVDVSIGKEHRLKQTGLYSFIRHPSYLGLVLEFLGYSLLINSWYPLFIINIPILLALHRRMNIEEELLISHFGDAYRQYKSKTWRLLPFLY